jgi:hypothetical protein
MILFAVKFGISMNEVRSMYIDRFIAYYKEIVYTMENAGELEKGSYEKSTVSQVESDKKVINQLRNMFVK